MRKPFLYKVILNAVGLFVISEYLVAGITFDGIPSLLVAAIILGVVNAIIRPIILVLSLPINLLTLGLLTLAVNGLMLSITAKLVSGMRIDSFWTAVWGAILLSAISYLFNTAFKEPTHRTRW